MTASAPTTTAPTPEFEEAVARRAGKLCTQAEPHGAAVPCVIHLSEARKALFTEWLVEP